LRDMMGDAGNDNAGKSGHGMRLGQGGSGVNKVHCHRNPVIPIKCTVTVTRVTPAIKCTVTVTRD
jgi:hypothetical protein